MSSSVKHPFNADLKLVELKTNKTSKTSRVNYMTCLRNNKREIIKEKTGKHIGLTFIHLKEYQILQSNLN